jgi:hypothetical protein
MSIDRTQTPILISMPRNGSHYVAHFIREIYKQNGLLTPYTFTNEFLDNRPTKGMPPIEQRIEFLESCRNTFQFDVFMTVHSHHLYQPLRIPARPNLYNVFDWFKEFYSGYQIVILRRKKLWKAFVSWMFHKSVRESLDRSGNVHAGNRDKLHYWHNVNNTGYNVEDTLKSTVLKYKPVFKYDNYNFSQFCASVRFLNETIIPYYDTAKLRPNLRNLWLEDCNDELLKNTFHPSNKIEEWSQPYKPFTIKYETYFGEYIDEMKDKFNDQYEKEFKYYGYTN